MGSTTHVPGVADTGKVTFGAKAATSREGMYPIRDPQPRSLVELVPQVPRLSLIVDREIH